MVQARENRADLTGGIVDVVATGQPAVGWIVLTLEVDGCSDVEGFPNMLDETVGQTVEVHIDARDDVGTLAPGDQVTLRARRASPRRIVGSLPRS